MTTQMSIIPLENLLFAFIPVGIVIVILYKWSLDYKHSIYAQFRMLIQLLLIGYLLTFIFDSDSSLLVMFILVFMVLVASWISLRTLSIKPQKLFIYAFISIGLGGGITLLLVTQMVVEVPIWYDARYLIPLAGMTFANSLTGLSLAGERFEAEISRGVKYEEARKIAYKASLIPVVNSLLAVGLVALPGMMTGQILSGISPLIAVRYQIMVMCMIFGSAGISTALFLVLIKEQIQIPKNKDIVNTQDE